MIRGSEKAGRPRIFTVRWIPGRADAITLPPLGIFVERGHEKDKWLMAHEKGHWEQFDDWGLFKYYKTVLTQY